MEALVAQNETGYLEPKLKGDTPILLYVAICYKKTVCTQQVPLSTSSANSSSFVGQSLSELLSTSHVNSLQVGH